MIYFDSGATTLEKPRAVRCAMARAVNTMSSPGRGSHQATQLAEETDYACRADQNTVQKYRKLRKNNILPDRR